MCVHVYMDEKEEQGYDLPIDSIDSSEVAR